MKRLAAFLAVLALLLPLPARAVGTNSTLPSQCATDDHPRGCWGNVRSDDINNGIRGALTQCPNTAAMAALENERDQLRRQIYAKKYPHFFMVPQGQAAYVSLLYAAVANGETACAATVSHEIRSTVLAISTYQIFQAADWARTAGNAAFFQQWSDRFFRLVDLIANDPSASPWAREYALWTKNSYCTTENPDIGPENPDYGRLFTWDDFHRVKCDNYRYG